MYNFARILNWIEISSYENSYNDDGDDSDNDDDDDDYDGCKENS